MLCGENWFDHHIEQAFISIITVKLCRILYLLWYIIQWSIQKDVPTVNGFPGTISHPITQNLSWLTIFDPTNNDDNHHISIISLECLTFLFLGRVNLTLPTYKSLFFCSLLIDLGGIKLILPTIWYPLYSYTKSINLGGIRLNKPV